MHHAVQPTRPCPPRCGTKDLAQPAEADARQDEATEHVATTEHPQPEDEQDGSLDVDHRRRGVEAGGPVSDPMVLASARSTRSSANLVFTSALARACRQAPALPIQLRPVADEPLLLDRVG